MCFCKDSRMTSQIINQKHKYGETALMEAVRHGALSCVREMDKLVNVEWDTRNVHNECLEDVARINDLTTDRRPVLKFLQDRNLPKSDIILSDGTNYILSVELELRAWAFLQGLSWNQLPTTDTPDPVQMSDQDATTPECVDCLLLGRFCWKTNQMRFRIHENQKMVSYWPLRVSTALLNTLFEKG